MQATIIHIIGFVSEASMNSQSRNLTLQALKAELKSKILSSWCYYVTSIFLKSTEWMSDFESSSVTFSNKIFCEAELRYAFVIMTLLPNYNEFVYTK